MSTILLVFALVLAILAAVGIPNPNPPSRWNLFAASFACFVASILFAGVLPLGHLGH